MATRVFSHSHAEHLRSWSIALNEPEEIQLVRQYLLAKLLPCAACTPQQHGVGHFPHLSWEEALSLCTADSNMNSDST